jgi:hypothetical protein
MPPVAQAATGATPIGPVDVSRATQDAARFFAAFFRAKSAADPDATMSHFTRPTLTYIDAVVGLSWFTWSGLHSAFESFMANWPHPAPAYETRVLGDATSAVVFMVNGPGLFGPNEIRTISAVDLTHGKATRWIDYWDSRPFGVANRDALAVPADQFPTDFRESLVGERAPSRITQAATKLNRALATGDTAGAVALFTPDASFVDLPSHIRIEGPHQITAFLTGARGLLPYTGSGVTVRHVLGSNEGGGYEWVATGPVPRGINALELDDRGRIAAFTSAWDAGLVTDDLLVRLAAAAIMH